MTKKEIDKEIKAFILAVDLGNYNIKTSENIMFESRFIIGKEIAPVGEELLEHDGKFYTMGKGTFENKYNKSLKNYLPNLLYAIGKSTTKDDKIIDLVLGVPLDTLNIKEKFKEDLKGKEFTFKINGEERTIKINRVATIGEGLSSYYTLDYREREKDLAIIDIGGRTTNVITFIDGKVEEKFTVTSGMLDLYDDIKTRVNGYGENYDLEEMRRLINNDTFEGVDNDKNVFLEEILNKIDFKIKLATYGNVYFTGGGAVECESNIKSLLPKSKAIREPLFSNAKGNKKVAMVKWGN